MKIKSWWSEDRKWFCVLVDDGICQATVSLTPEEADAFIKSTPHLLHASDCAIYNEPAFPKGECDCGASAPQPSREEMLAVLKEIVELEQERLTNSPMFAQRSVASIITILDRARAVIARADNAGKPEGEGR